MRFKKNDLILFMPCQNSIILTFVPHSSSRYFLSLYFPQYVSLKALTQKNEQHIDIGLNMGYYIYIYKEEMQGTRFIMGYYIYMYVYKEQIQGTTLSRIHAYSNPFSLLYLYNVPFLCNKPELGDVRVLKIKIGRCNIFLRKSI